ncbi:tRNA (5-methylaminomethyl-2-thiouridine)(34)-methyltransferase MnmD [Parashewanella tropica]|uniref:tRNA (5-methylaminomethyl-2-thiouridine)(34)-methyltransferase MnmD n=1 Tax=Parashewanella tropica TaxID=2547970 RepID=UPI001059DCA6|nr:tRNA (5-methylaminomethyl-2-thiouridine)(34)-methyltransferase MnmD [Parashewanella tropica]
MSQIKSAYIGLMQEVQLHITKDGSHTLINPSLEESYHAYNGAHTESQYVYIQCGLEYYISNRSDSRDPITILEFGFGTGLNALLTLQHCTHSNTRVHYISLEPFPVPAATALQLNYTDNLAQPYPELFRQLHTCEWNNTVKITENFELKKLNQKLHETKLEPNSIDIIFYDAFAPSKQPDAWEKQLFEKCFEALKPNGLLVSYCANGQFKRDLKSIGFTLDQCKGPMGRREITRAWKN